MSTIRRNNKEEIEFHPYGETQPYSIAFGWSTGPMKEPGISISRREDNRYSGGCIPVEDIDVLIRKLCRFRGYQDPTGLTKNKKAEKLPEHIVQVIL